MKKFVAFIIISMAVSLQAGAEETQEKNNPGYMASHGMIGGFAFTPDFAKKSFEDGHFGGGGFVYYNVFNKFWGNVAVGLSAEYSNTKYKKESPTLTYRTNLDLTPVALNFAYMTASDFLNAWGGFAVSYNFVSLDIRDGQLVNNGVSSPFGKQSRINEGLFGVDLFAGAEYIFTANGRWGVFFEFRYTFADALHVNKYIVGPNADLKDTLNLQRFRYTLGVSFHY